MEAHTLAKTFSWGPGDWIAFGMLVATVLSMLVGGIVLAIKVAHRFGVHDQRLVQAETQIRELRASDKNADSDRTELAVLTALMKRMEDTLRDLGGDLNRRMGGIEADIRRYLARREDT